MKTTKKLEANEAPEPREAQPAPADKARQDRRTVPRVAFQPLPRRSMFRERREGER